MISKKSSMQMELEFFGATMADQQGFFLITFLGTDFGFLVLDELVFRDNLLLLRCESLLFDWLIIEM